MPAFVVEYRKIGLLGTCIGNERIRLADDGRVYHSRNTRECQAGEPWSADWQLVGTLKPTELAELAHELRRSGLLQLPPVSVDDAAHDGKREELDIAIDGASQRFVVQNVEVAEFRRAVRELWGAVARAEMTAKMGSN